MKKVEVTLKEEDKFDITYDLVGETHDDVFHVGDTIKATTQIGSVLRGKVKEIFRSKNRGIYSLKLESGWCAHPTLDTIEVTTPYDSTT